MSRADEIWIDATAVSHGTQKFAGIKSGSLGETTESKVVSKATFSGDEVSFAKAAVEAQAAHERGPKRNPNLEVEVNVDSFSFRGLGGKLPPLLTVKKVLARLESEDTLNFDKSRLESLRIFGHLVDISYKSSGERRGGFLFLKKSLRFPFPFKNVPNAQQKEDTIVRELSWKSANSKDALLAEEVEVEFMGNRIKIDQSGERIAEIKLGVVTDQRPPSANGRQFARLTMCEIQFPPSASKEGDVETSHRGEGEVVNPNALEAADGVERALSEPAENASGSTEDEREFSPEQNGSVTRVGDVRSDSVGT